MKFQAFTEKEWLNHFWLRVVLSTSCWYWIGALHTFGYGLVKYKGKMVAAHRRMYEIMRGPIPPGMVVRHKCDVPMCVNPFHLAIGTQADNIHDAMSRKRNSFGELNYNSKMSDAQVDECRRRWTNGVTSTELAATYGVSRETINNIVQYRTRAIPTSEHFKRRHPVSATTTDDEHKSDN